MINSVRGRVNTVYELPNGLWIVEVETPSGITFEIHIYRQAGLLLKQEADDTQIVTRMITSTSGEVRLFGFKSQRQREVFDELITVKRIGPVVAMRILEWLGAFDGRGYSLREILSSEGLSKELAKEVSGLGMAAMVELRRKYCPKKGA